MAALKNKRVLLALMLLLSIAVYFWLSSRYPALNEKALMGDTTAINGISFNTVLEVVETDPWWKRSAYNFVNWAYTNKQGMTFGILFAAAIMLIIGLLRKHQFQNRFANSFLGLVIGAPLGVCVNCATPIAEGFKRSGGRLETAMAMMMSSPTMNVIVLSMLFSLFPSWMVVIKIGFTLLFILVGIPLLSKLFAPKNRVELAVDSVLNAEANKVDKYFSDTYDKYENDNTWPAALRWLVIQYFSKLWQIAKLALPFMALAGLLGSLVITFMPWEYIVQMDFQTDIEVTLLIMVGLAILGVFLPVPMAFDIIIVAVLVAAGVPPRFTLILLFTLGVFSVYPWLLIRRTVSKKFAWISFSVLVVIGFTAGATGHLYDKWQWQQVMPERLEAFKNSDSEGPRTEVFYPEENFVSEQELRTSLDASAPSPSANFETTGVLIKGYTFNQTPPPTGKKHFEEQAGNEIGLSVGNSISVMHFLEPYAQAPGMAAGDVHNDGWPDIAIAHVTGLYLFANQEGQFVRQQVNLKGIEDLWFSNAVLIDLNNDGWLDLYTSTYRNGNYVFYNDHGSFGKAMAVALPNHSEAVLTYAPAFGDLNQDGDLEVFLGNWSLGTETYPRRALNSSKNVLLHPKDNGDYEMEVIEGISGETLTTLMADINNDGNTDLVVGNDFLIPDRFFFGDGQGELRETLRKDGLIEKTGQQTMSFSMVDINNDLVPEMYVAQIANMGMDIGTEVTEVTSALSYEVQYPGYKELFGKMLSMHQAFTLTGRKLSLSYCPQGWEDDCMAILTYSDAKAKRNLGPNSAACDYFPEGWETYKWLCLADREAYTEYSKEEVLEYIHQKNEDNFLFQLTESGSYVDLAPNYGITRTGWTWNAKFADLDNDEWQDLYAVNGYYQNQVWERNFLFMNQKGKGMANESEASGLGSFLPSQAYLYLDYDLDGDIDILTTPHIGPVKVYTNSTQGNSIAVELRDSIGNSHGVGSKVFIYYGEGKSQMKEIVAGGGSKSFDLLEARFGLGEHNQINRLRILWSTGEETIIEQTLQAHSKYVITRPATNEERP